MTFYFTRSCKVCIIQKIYNQNIWIRTIDPNFRIQFRIETMLMLVYNGLFSMWAAAWTIWCPGGRCRTPPGSSPPSWSSRQTRSHLLYRYPTNVRKKSLMQSRPLEWQNIIWILFYLNLQPVLCNRNDLFRIWIQQRIF